MSVHIDSCDYPVDDLSDNSDFELPPVVDEPIYDIIETLTESQLQARSEIVEEYLDSLSIVLKGLRPELFSSFYFQDLTSLEFTEEYYQFVDYLNGKPEEEKTPEERSLEDKMEIANKNIIELNKNIKIIRSELEAKNYNLRKCVEYIQIDDLEPNVDYLFTYPDKKGIVAVAANESFFMNDIKNIEYELPISQEILFKKINREDYINNHEPTSYQGHQPNCLYSAVGMNSAWRKYMDSRGIKEVFDKSSCIIVTYDIECGRIDSNDFPHPGNPNVKVGLICAKVYDMNYNQISQWNGSTFHSNLEDVKFYANDSIMCIEFINYILELQQKWVVILTSFNGSSAYPKGGKRDETPEFIGFDLSHILYKSGLYHKNKKVVNCKALNNGYQVAIVPAMGSRCLHLDLRPWLIADTTFRASDVLDGTTLNDFLALCKIPAKLDCDHVEGTKIIFEMESSMSVQKYVEYCQYDAHALVLLMRERSFVDKIEAVCKYFETGLYSALYLTSVKMITNKVMRDYYLEGYAFSYDNNNLSSEKFEYRGALTFAPPEDLQSRTITEPVLGEDFVSLYPNVMLSRSIAPETYLGQSDEPIVEYDPKDVVIFENVDELCRDPALKKYIYFKRIDPRESPLLRFINNCFLERVRIKRLVESEKDPIKKKYLDNMQYALKIAINSSYGALAFRSCLFYSPYAGACVTLGARYALSALRKTVGDYAHGDFIIGDTDSSFILCNFNTEEDQAKTAGIEDILSTIAHKTQQNLLWSPYDENAVKNYDVACEDFFIRTLFSKAKKSYLALNITGKTAWKDFINYYNSNDTKINYVDGKLTYTVNGVEYSNLALLSRGLQLGQFRADIKKLIKSFLIEWLINPISVNDPESDIVNEFIRDWVRKLVLTIKTEIVDDRKKYAHKIKLSGKSGKVEYLKATYPRELEGLSEVYILPVKNSSKKKSEKWAPISVCDINKIDYREVLAPICSNLARFVPTFKKYTVNKKSFMGQEYDQSYSFNFRCEQLLNDKVVAEIKACEIDGVPELLESYDSVHEVILTDNIRMFFDIDGEDINVENFANSVRKLCGSLGNHLKVFVASAHTEKKKSYHITFNAATSLANLKFIASSLKKEFRGIDLGVYSIGKSLRIPLTYKIDRKNNIIDKRPFVFAEELCTLEDFLLSDIRSLILIDGKPHVYDKIPLDLNTNMIKETFGVLPPTIKLKIEELLGSKIKIQNSGGFYRIEPLKRNVCPMCGNTHERDNSYCYKSGNAWMLGCYRTQQKIKIEKTENDIKIDQMILDTVKEIMTEEGDVFDVSPNKVPEPLIISDFEGLLSIKAQMGVGKTKAIGELIDSQNLQRIVYISPRRTLSRNMSERLGLQNYMEISGEISLQKHRKLIIQIDSLGRIELDSKIDILILDEWSSTLNQISGSCIATNFGKMYNIVSKLQRMSFDATRTVIMDANLTAYDISLAEQLFRRQANIIENFIKPFDFKLDIVQLRTGRQRAHYLVSDFERLIHEGKKIAFSCTSVKLAKKTAAYFADLNPVLLTGLDQDVYTLNGVEKNIFQWKHEFMANPDKFLNEYKPQMMIYTTTMTCGVSINIDYFDVLVGYYNPTSNPIEFCQSLGRCRKINDKHAIIYIPDSTKYVGPTIPCKLLQATTKRPYISKMDSLKIALNARENAQLQYGIYVVAQSMKEMGYKLNSIKVLDGNYCESKSDWNSNFPKLPKEDLEVLNLYRENDYNEAIIELLRKYEVDEYNTKMTTIFPDYYKAKTVQKIQETTRLSLEEFKALPYERFEEIHKVIKIIRAHQYENPESWLKEGAIFDFLARKLDISTSDQSILAKAMVAENINEVHEDLLEPAALESQVFTHLHYDLRSLAEKVYSMVKNWKSERQDSPKFIEVSELIKSKVNIINKVLRTSFSKKKVVQIINGMFLYVQKGRLDDELTGDYDKNRNIIMAHTYVPVHLIEQADKASNRLWESIEERKRETLDRQEQQIPPIVIVTDGACKNQKSEIKTTSFGCVFYNEQGELLTSICGKLGNINNVTAEYLSIINGLKFALENGYKRVKIINDCISVVNQILGTNKISKKAEYLKPYLAEVESLEMLFDSFEIIHKSRKFTKCADTMANYAITNDLNSLSEFVREKCPVDNDNLAIWFNN